MGLSKEARRKQIIRRCGKVAFVCYLILLSYFLFLSELHDHVYGIHAQYHYNLVPFREILRFWNAREQLGFNAVFLNLFGNVLGFLPLGALLPAAFPWFHHAYRTIPTGILFSLMVETLQLLTLIGRFDVDDVILNSLGVALGYICFKAANGLRRKKYRNGKNKKIHVY